MQVRVTKKEVKERGPEFAGQLLNVTWMIKLWPNDVSIESTDPVVKEDITHDYSKHADPNQLNEQDARIDKFLEEKAKELIGKYLNEKNLLEKEPRIDDRTTKLQTKLETTYGSM